MINIRYILNVWKNTRNEIMNNHGIGQGDIETCTEICINTRLAFPTVRFEIWIIECTILNDGYRLKPSKNPTPVFRCKQLAKYHHKEINMDTPTTFYATSNV